MAEVDSMRFSRLPVGAGCLWQCAFRAQRLRSVSGTIAFRVDDVEAYWESANMQAIDHFFLEKHVPLTIGVITSTEWTLKEHAPGVATARAAIDAFAKSGTPFEVASHSSAHPDSPGFDGKSLAWQMRDLTVAQQRIHATTGNYASTFIPPDNQVDANTYTALRTIRHPMTVISGQCTWPRSTGVPWPQPSQSGPSGVSNFCTGQGQFNAGASLEQSGRAPNINVDGIAAAPAGAVIDSWANYQEPANLDFALHWITTQSANQGFAVVMLHPQELSGGIPDALAGMGTKSTLNPQKMRVLTQLIQWGRSHHWNFTTLSGLSAAMSSTQEQNAA